MFIMSQDKEDFINLDNVKMVTVDENIVGIDVNFAKADFYEIGAYESEERAQEVLEEITKKYKEGILICRIGENKYTHQENVYEMPEE